MAKGTSKRAFKTPSSSSLNPAKPPTTPAPTYPFSPPSPSLLPFLSTLPPGPLYILHLDPFPASHKKKIFLVPLLLNTTLTLLLLWRISVAIPVYISILAATLGVPSPAAINISDTPWPRLIAIGLGRACMFSVDFALVRVVAIWPRDFFWGADGLGPLRWRWAVGFREREVVVRRSRRWWGPGAEGARDVGERVERERERVIPVIERGWVQGRTGYAMLDRNWDLYFTGMVHAHRLVDQGPATLGDFERKMVVWTEKEGWLVWDIGKWEREEREARGGERTQNHDQ